jgi:hypothetical protein
MHQVNIFAAEENKADSLTVPFINESDLSAYNK